MISKITPIGDKTSKPVFSIIVFCNARLILENEMLLEKIKDKRKRSQERKNGFKITIYICLSNCNCKVNKDSGDLSATTKLRSYFDPKNVGKFRKL